MTALHELNCIMQAHVMHTKKPRKEPAAKLSFYDCDFFIACRNCWGIISPSEMDFWQPSRGPGLCHSWLRVLRTQHWGTWTPHACTWRTMWHWPGGSATCCSPLSPSTAATGTGSRSRTWLQTSEPFVTRIDFANIIPHSELRPCPWTCPIFFC